ncbi:uncharacterized protein [Eurosta solidaginis]|uniref:uncharacterized protein isoform X2 n=1 Tax=Eurosta solidaginis TaxID=178769 RepID=UPI00353082EF
MAEDTVQIKQEPLDVIYAAEIADINDVVAATTTSSSSNKISMYGTGRRACDILNKFGVASTMAVGFSNNVTIKIEPQTDANDEICSGEYVGDCGGITAQELLEHRNEMSDVHVKSEPIEDDTNNYSSNDFVLPSTLTNSSNANETAEEKASCHDFQVVDEHEKFITISAADLSPEKGILELKQKLQAMKELSLPVSLPKPVIRNHSRCPLCGKQVLQDLQFKHYTHHMEQHRKNRMFCIRKICDSWFISLEECEKHEFETHDIKHFKCNVCNHKFRDFEQMSEHKIKMHNKLIRYNCSLCRDWFISLAELQEHWSFLPDFCGRLANIDALEKSHKLKRAPTTDVSGLKLRLQAISPHNDPVNLGTRTQMNGIEIKEEPIDPESMLPCGVIKKNINTNPSEKYQATTTNKNNLTAVPQLKLRLRKQPLSPTRMRADYVDPPVMQNNSNPLGQLLARRIMSKFSLKTIPKMFNLTNKVNEIKEQQEKKALLQQQQPQQQEKLALQVQRQEEQHIMPSKAVQAQPFTKWQKDTILTFGNEPPPKMLKLSNNLKIISYPLPPPTQKQKEVNTTTTIFHTLTKLPKSAQHQPPNTSVVNTNGPGEKPATTMFRQFTLESVKIPALDKHFAVAKLEAVTKANKELTLTELLDEVIVREKINAITSNENKINTTTSTNNDVTVEQMLLQQQESSSEKEAEEIKNKFIENMMAALEKDDSQSTANLSESALDSSSISVNKKKIEDDSGNIPHQRSRSLPANEKEKEKNVPNFPKSECGDYICPRCGRRYSLATTVQEHLNSNCGRNLRHECEAPYHTNAITVINVFVHVVK